MNSSGETAERTNVVRELLALPDFLRLWLVGAFANAMRWLETLASGLFAYEITGSALAVAGVVAARQLPQLFFGAFAGAVSEAVDRKLIVMLALILPASISTVLATLATTGHLELWHVALGNFAAGTISASMTISLRLTASDTAPAKAPKASCGSWRKATTTGAARAKAPANCTSAVTV